MWTQSHSVFNFTREDSAAMGEPTNQLFAALQHREAVDQGVEAPQQKERRKKKLEQEQKEKEKM